MTVWIVALEESSCHVVDNVHVELARPTWPPVIGPQSLWKESLSRLQDSTTMVTSST
jgi:hypothetical protein